MSTSRALTISRPSTEPVALSFVSSSVCERISAVTVNVCPGSTNWLYFTLAACFSVTRLWAKSSLRRTSQAEAWVIASSINTPGMTGKLGKWSAKYSSLIVSDFSAVMRTPG